MEVPKNNAETTNPSEQKKPATLTEQEIKNQEAAERESEAKKRQSEADDQKRIQELRDEHGFDTSNQKRDIPKEVIEKVENYPHLDLQEKVELLLVLGGFKKANEQYFESEEWYDGQPQKMNDEEKIKSYEKLLEEIGLIFEKKRDITKGNRAYIEDNYEFVRNIERVKYIFAKKKEDIEKYKKAGEEGSDELFGEVYGFPETAIKAFGRPNGLIKYNELPEDIRNDEAYAFYTFEMSRENFREEFETMKKWAEFVKQNSPKIYQDYIEYRKKVKGR
jgi:hypothetical protein